MEMQISIFWNKGNHGDAENVFGSIADSLFSQDKWLDGSFKGRDSKNGEAWVDVELIFLNDSQ